ncbi:MAG: UDP-N-acetylmuramate dehydrogenase [Clostridiales bacterium]|nr:UDP-N-acetylmuramate dehydrogenase [Clostridiales bacterium]
MAVDNSTIEVFHRNLIDAGFAELEGALRADELMKGHTSFRVGGPAQIYAEPRTSEEIAALISAAKSASMPYFLMGNGSNLVVSDEGIEGLVIRLGELFSEIRSEVDSADPENVRIFATAGTLLIRLSSFAAKEGLSGLEFASGIPGSLGGAVFMNAGAYGHDISEVVDKVTAISKDGGIRTWKRDQLSFGYRKSTFMEEEGIITEVELVLRRGDPEMIASQIREYTEKRTKSQPLQYPSAGSMFKRPEGHYTGALIEQAGLKGFSIGGAQVSEKHAGFVINTGEATAADIDALVKHIQKTVFEKYGVSLEREVRFVGRGFSSGEK